MMKKYDQTVETNYNPKWLYIPDHHCRISIIGDSRLGKTNMLLNLIKNQRPDIDNIYLYVEDPYKSKRQLGINRSENEKFDDMIAHMKSNKKN